MTCVYSTFLGHSVDTVSVVIILVVAEVLMLRNLWWAKGGYVDVTNTWAPVVYSCDCHYDVCVFTLDPESRMKIFCPLFLAILLPGENINAITSHSLLS